MLRTISRFWVVLFCLFSFRTVDPQPIDAFGDVQSLPVGYTISCVGAKQVRYGDLDFCNMISWRTANIYNSTSFSAYEPENGLSARSQDAVARSLVEDILSGSTRHPSSFCRAAVKRFACVAVFPYCPSSGGASSSTSYLPACNRQCMQVHDICKESYFSTESIVPLDCSAYPIDHNCVLNVPKNRFLLLPEQVYNKYCIITLIRLFIEPNGHFYPNLLISRDPTRPFPASTWPCCPSGWFSTAFGRTTRTGCTRRARCRSRRRCCRCCPSPACSWPPSRSSSGTFARLHKV